MQNITAPPPDHFVDSRLRPPIYFLHLQKTAGTSLRMFLNDQYPYEKVGGFHHWRNILLFEPEELRSHRAVASHPFPNLQPYLPQHRCITFLRDPMKRAISFLRHMIRAETFTGHRLVKGRPLRELIHDQEIMEKIVANGQCRTLCMDVPYKEAQKHFATPLGQPNRGEYFELNWESSLEKARGVLAKCDYVGLVEYYDDCVLDLCAKYNFVPPEAMPMRNPAEVHLSTRREGSTDKLTPEDREHLRKHLQDDYTLYEEVRKKWAPQHDSRMAMMKQLLANGTLKPVDGPLDMFLGTPFAGSGFYQPEIHHAKPPTRWIGPNPKGTLYLPLSQGSARTGHLYFHKPEVIPKILIDGQEVKTKNSKAYDRVMVSFTIPARGKKQPITSITIDSQQVAPAASDPSEDDRHVGALLVGAEITAPVPFHQKILNRLHVKKAAG